MQNLQRYIFAFLGIIALIGLVVLDKVYTGGQPVPVNVFRIVAVFIVGCLVGADNLTSIVALIVKKFIGDGNKN